MIDPLKSTGFRKNRYVRCMQDIAIDLVWQISTPCELYQVPSNDYLARLLPEAAPPELVPGLPTRPRTKDSISLEELKVKLTLLSLPLLTVVSNFFSDIFIIIQWLFNRFID